MKEDNKFKLEIGQWSLFLLVIIVVAVVLYLVVSALNFKAENFAATGPIGDTIGGLTAPFVGLIGAVLVYISFQAQLRANQIQFDALQDERKRASAERWYQYNMNRSEMFKGLFESFKIKIPIQVNSNYSEANTIALVGLKALDKLEDYSYKSVLEITSSELRCRIDGEFEYIRLITRFTVFIEKLYLKHDIYDEEFEEIYDNIKDYYTDYIIMPLRRLTNRSNSETLRITLAPLLESIEKVMYHNLDEV